jgi:hypothetical protein
LQWGVGKHPLLFEPADLRESDAAAEHGSGSSVEFDSKNLMYLDFTRQVMASQNGDEDEEEFDDAAVQMSLTLVYGPGGHKNESGNLWISSPKRLDHDLKKFVANPFVSSIIDLEPTRYVGTVDFAG